MRSFTWGRVVVLQRLPSWRRCRKLYRASANAAASGANKDAFDDLDANSFAFVTAAASRRQFVHLAALRTGKPCCRAAAAVVSNKEEIEA